jgi:hypothetical protein
MQKRIKIPKYAKNQAKKGLEERKKNKAGLTPKEAKKLGIYSGVARAKQIISNKYLDEKDLKSIARFYIRFKNCKTPKCETAIKLWGGRKFGLFLYNLFYS